jgi:molybdate transport system ATP-binding protein
VRASRSERGLRIDLQGVSLHRDERRILEGVHWSLAPGERWVLVGANGAGKTQLLKLVAGSVWPDPDTRGQRRYLWRGREQPLPEAMPQIAYLGPERQDRHERHDWNFPALEVVGTGITRSDIPQGPMRASQRRSAERHLAAVGLGRFAARRMLELSFGERRLVLIARALASRPQWLLLDELLAGLDERNRRRTQRWLDGHAGSWVLSTHRREEIPRSATHFAELADGRLVRAGPITAADRRSASGGRHADEGGDAARCGRRGRTPRAPRTPLVACEGVDVYLDYRAVLRGLDFAVAPGDCWVVHGGNGAGKSTLLRSLYGDHPAALGGHIHRRGIRRGVPLEVFRRWCAIVGPHLQATPPPGETVLENVVSGLRSSIGLDQPPTPGERRRALAGLREFELHSCADLPLRTLSWGQVRRVLLARALVLRPRLLLLDEVLSGIDVGTRQVLLQRIETFVAAGGAVVLVSHHRDEWPRNASHELELRAGRVRYAGPLRPARG